MIVRKPDMLGSGTDFNQPLRIWVLALGPRKCGVWWRVNTTFFNWSTNWNQNVLNKLGASVYFHSKDPKRIWWLIMVWEQTIIFFTNQLQEQLTFNRYCTVSAELQAVNVNGCRCCCLWLKVLTKINWRVSAFFSWDTAIAIRLRQRKSELFIRVCWRTICSLWDERI